MDADTAPTRTTGATFPQGTSSTDLRRKMHGPAWLKKHLLLVRTADPLLLPIKLKGCLEKARAIAYRPGFAVDHQISRPLADQRATEVSPINMQFGQLRLLCGEIRLDRLGDAGFWHIGGGVTPPTPPAPLQLCDDLRGFRH